MKKEIFVFVALIILIMFALTLFNRISLVNIEKHIKDQDPIYLQIETGTVMIMKATGYAIGPPYNSVTRDGRPVISKGYITIGGIDVFTVAADPNVLKMGSVIYIVGWGFGIVTDTGPAIKGMEIDICFTTMDEAMRFGKQDVKVYLLRDGKENKKGGENK